MKRTITIIAIVIVVLGAIAYFAHDKEPAVGLDPSAGAEIKYASDIIGSRTGTTTTGVKWDGVSTTTYRAKLGGNIEQVNLFIKAITASTSAAAPQVTMNIFGTNDWDCITASTTGGAQNNIVTTDINWYDVGHHVLELAGSKTLSQATSTILWTPTVTHGTELTLTNLNYECLRFDVAASSTKLFMQMRNN